MMRWRAAALGAAAFLAAHAVILWQWATLAGTHGNEPAWFANSTGAVVVMVVAMATAGIAAARGSSRGHERTRLISSVALGGIVAMVATMVVVGGGTIAPLAVTMGGAVLVTGAFAGGIIASLFVSPR